MQKQIQPAPGTSAGTSTVALHGDSAAKAAAHKGQDALSQIDEALAQEVDDEQDQDQDQDQHRSRRGCSCW